MKLNGMCLFASGKVPCELDRIVSELTTPVTVNEKCMAICCNVVESGILKRRPLSTVAAASVYAGCRETKTPITLRELAVVSRSDAMEIGKCYKLIMDKLEITPPALNGISYSTKVATKLGISTDSANLASEIVKKAAGKGLNDRNPMTLAAAAVYTACLARGESVRQSDAADAAGVSVISVRECAKQLRSIVEAPPETDSVSPGASA